MKMSLVLIRSTTAAKAAELEFLPGGYLDGKSFTMPTSFEHLQVMRQQLPMYLQSSRIMHSSKQCRFYYMLFEVPRYSFCPVSESHNQTNPSKKIHGVGFVDTKR